MAEIRWGSHMAGLDWFCPVNRCEQMGGVSLDQIEFRSFEWWLDDYWREAIHEGGVYKLEVWSQSRGDRGGQCRTERVSSILEVRNGAPWQARLAGAWFLEAVPARAGRRPS